MLHTGVGRIYHPMGRLGSTLATPLSSNRQLHQAERPHNSTGQPARPSASPQHHDEIFKGHCPAGLETTMSLLLHDGCHFWRVGGSAFSPVIRNALPLPPAPAPAPGRTARPGEGAGGGGRVFMLSVSPSYLIPVLMPCLYGI
jgi:hypothetical protein